MYVRVWEYDVDPERADEFVAAYDAAGDWSQLFRRGTGYAGTRLYRSSDDATSLVTVDRWASEAAWAEFLSQHRDQYDALDARTSGLSRAQRELIAGTGPTAP